VAISLADRNDDVPIPRFACLSALVSCNSDDEGLILRRGLSHLSSPTSGLCGRARCPLGYDLH
jgi:hypothetical protein